MVFHAAVILINAHRAKEFIMAENKVGAYSPFAQPSDEDKKVLKELGLAGVDYEPLLVSKQLVSNGWNYLYVTNAKVVSPVASPYAALVKFYKPADGKAEKLDVKEIGHPNVVGGYSPFRALDAEAKDVLREVQRRLLGTQYNACLMAAKTEKGKEYLFVANETVVIPGAEPEPVFLKAVQPPEGEVMPTDVIKAGDYR
jgi:hypothetical protein